MLIKQIDHIVLTCFDITATKNFYTGILEMELETFADNRFALRFGAQKINLHEYGKEFEPKAHLPTPGSLDICFISAVPINHIVKLLSEHNWPIIDGPVIRTGATGKIQSIYIRDPDFNLIEISEYL